MIETKSKRLCYFVLESITNDKGDFVPCIAVEGEKGYNLTDWAWGNDYGVADRLAIGRNEKMGIDKTEAMKIIASTIR